VNLLHLVIILIVIAAGVHGLLLGAAAQVLSFGGVAIGLAVGAALAPAAARLGSDPPTKATFALLSLFGCTLVFGAAGRRVAARVWGRIRRSGLALVDAGTGTVLAAAAALRAAEPALDLVSAAVPRGTPGSSSAYPLGGPFDAKPAVLLARLEAVGRDIYGRGLTTRAA
jgi:colicin V production protein